jgi:hypothetical protein
MAFNQSLSFVLAFFLWGAPQAATPQNTTVGPDNNAKATTATPSAPPSAMDQAIDKAIMEEQNLVNELKNYTPMVETYIQDMTNDKTLGAVPTSDRYFLGKLDLQGGVNQHSLLAAPGFAQNLKGLVTQFYSVKYLPDGFAQMILVDGKAFDRTNYKFEFVRREFLGEVRCLVFDVQPVDTGRARFTGRIWVEDEDFHIVRFNGTYSGSSMSKMYFHFDSWRENMGPGLWLPAYVYTEESNVTYLLGQRHLRFKGQTRIWGYNVGRNNGQNELTSMTVEADKVEDNGDATEHMSPIISQRKWERQAEDNVLQRMEKARLLAPEGSEVDKVLQTVVTNVEVTNNLTIEPEVRVRVLLTSPLETFTVGHTIVVSRGLIDVLPDEASLATVLAHELAHISLDHHIDTKYSFADRMMFDDTQTYQRVQMRRDSAEEKEADQKAMELLQNSPYADKLANAGLFLRALNSRAMQLPHLVATHVGNPLATGKDIKRMPDLMQNSPALEADKVEQIAALPLGGRMRVDPWSDKLELIKTKPVALLSAREKMPFEITPVYIYLTRQKNPATPSTKNNN